MTIFQTVKSSLTPRQVAEHCGMTVGRNGMVCCPFHAVGASSIFFAPPQAAGLIHSAAPPLPTKSSILREPFWHPSMKLNEDYFFCFGCGESGDVIGLAGKLFGCSPSDAAHRLAADFGITEGKTSVLPMLKPHKTQAQDEQTCFRVLVEYLHTLQDWKNRYAPAAPDAPLHPRFLEAIHALDYIEYLVDLLITGDPGERAEVVEAMKRDNRIGRLQERLREIGKEDAHERAAEHECA